MLTLVITKPTPCISFPTEPLAINSETCPINNLFSTITRLETILVGVALLWRSDIGFFGKITFSQNGFFLPVISFLNMFAWRDVFDANLEWQTRVAFETVFSTVLCILIKFKKLFSKNNFSGYDMDLTTENYRVCQTIVMNIQPYTLFDASHLLVETMPAAFSQHLYTVLYEFCSCGTLHGTTVVVIILLRIICFKFKFSQKHSRSHGRHRNCW